MNLGRRAIFACLLSSLVAACGGQDFGANTGGGGSATGGASAQTGGVSGVGVASGGRAGAAGSAGNAQGGSAPQGAAGEPSEPSSGAAGAAGAPDVGVGCDPTAPFGEPGLIPGGVNSSDDDLSPRLSKDELTIYFARRTVNNLTAPMALYAATRPDIAAPFSSGTKLAINTDQSNGDPMLTSDGGTLFFSSDRPNGLGELDLYQSSHALPSLPFVTASPVPDVNSAGSEVEPFAASDGELWFAYRKPGLDSALHLRRAPRTGAGYAAPVPVMELDSTSEDNWPLLSPDKLTIYYSSLRSDGGAHGKADIWRAQRLNATAVFDPPSDVSELNTAATDYVGWLSEDACRLYLSSNRMASRGYEIYVATR